MNIIVVLGPQGSGKGTQSELLAKELGFLNFDTGNFLRELAKKDPRIDEIINKKGQMVPAEETVNLVTRYIEDNLGQSPGVVFDGFPRSLDQYKFFKKWLDKNDREINLVIFLEVSDEEAIRRLSARRICASCGKVYNLITNPPPQRDFCGVCGGKLFQRPDDREEAIAERLRLYHEKTQPLVNLFEKEGLLFRVNGERPIDVIFEEIKRKVRV